jgi:hypothetical protein
VGLGPRRGKADCQDGSCWLPDILHGAAFTWSQSCRHGSSSSSSQQQRSRLAVMVDCVMQLFVVACAVPSCVIGDGGLVGVAGASVCSRSLLLLVAVVNCGGVSCCGSSVLNSSSGGVCEIADRWHLKPAWWSLSCVPTLRVGGCSAQPGISYR